jgi:Protein of unknown function (DUF2569).
MAEKTELKGVGGWLAFLVLSMALLSPARTLYGYYRDVVVTERNMGLAGNPVWETYTTIVLILVVIGCLLFFLAAYRLYRQHVWRSVRFAIVAMWVACTGMDAIGMVALYFVFGGEFAVMIFQNVTGELIKGLVYPAIWTLYLLKSRRVRNTYRRETDMEELARHLGVREK